MTETILENQMCQACGTEIRPEALFCYHCGGPMAQPISDNNNNHDKKSGISAVSGEQTNREMELKSAPLPTPDNLDENSVETGLKPASALRNRVGKLEPQKIEIIWEKHEDAPNLWFVTATLILTFLAILIYFAANYLK